MSDFLYNKKTHEAIKINEKEKIATVHLSQHCIDSLGDIVYVELPKIGSSVEKEKSLGIVESVKAADDIYGISGKIIEVNKTLNDNPEKINEDPLEEGWLVKIKIPNLEEINNNLLNYEQHLEFIKE